MPQKFNIIYTTKFTSTQYQLSLTLTIKLDAYYKNVYIIELLVLLPDDYPQSNYKNATNRVAYVLITYFKNEKRMNIDLLYVYNTITKYKKLISDNEKFNTKGLGQYMLCKAVEYLLENIDFDFDIESIVTLKASAEDCRYTDYREYTFDYCMEEITKYPAMFILLFDYVKDTYIQELKDKLPDGVILNRQNKENVDEKVKDILYKHKTDAKLLEILQKYTCEIKTNHDLIKNYYNKIYGFNIKEGEDGGIYAELVGNIHSLLSACKISKMSKQKSK